MIIQQTDAKSIQQAKCDIYVYVDACMRARVLVCGTYCKYWMSSSSHGFCSTLWPMQWLPPPLGAGLLQLLVLDFWPPEQDPQEDQQLHWPLINPDKKKELVVYRWCQGLIGMLLWRVKERHSLLSARVGFVLFGLVSSKNYHKVIGMATAGCFVMFCIKKLCGNRSSNWPLSQTLGFKTGVGKRWGKMCDVTVTPSILSVTSQYM